MNFLNSVLRAGEKNKIKKIEDLTNQVNIWTDYFKKLTDSQLRAKTEEFRMRLSTEEDTIDTLLPEAYACVRETSDRVLGKRHYDVQIMGGIALHFGDIAEMGTGEGKTLVATLPSYLNALSGEGVHVVTVNDYLAERDANNMGRIHQFLGLKVSCLLSDMDTLERQKAYLADITYGTNNEFGFDYLRDNMILSELDAVQRGQKYAIVDEVDSILIDEARTPLIISGISDSPISWYIQLSQLVASFVIEEDYTVDVKKHAVAIKESGVRKAEDWLGVESLYQVENAKIVGQLYNALKAKELYKKDKDYVIIKNKVILVDEHTGRTMPDRRYGEGLHQSIEAKEKVIVEAETHTYATVTLQNYFKLYDKLSGMTGTASTEAAELQQIYKLGVVKIPPNKPSVRTDHDDYIFQTEESKLAAVVEDIKNRNMKGQPVLIGTVSVEKSEQLSKMLKQEHIRHNVLNAKNNKREAEIIADAGRKGAVTVATNMAGRGTDIMLGGNPEKIAETKMKKAHIKPPSEEEISENPEIIEVYSKAYNNAYKKAEIQVANEHEQVVKLGGLYVLGTERHESRRIDNQLRGRSGRQGDPGETRFYLSFEDELVQRFNFSTAQMIMKRFNFPDDVPIQAKTANKLMASAQSQMETLNFDSRKDIVKYDEILNTQRTLIYAERKKILHHEHAFLELERMLKNVVEEEILLALPKYGEDWDIENIKDTFSNKFNTNFSAEDLTDILTNNDKKNIKILTEKFYDAVHKTFEDKTNELVNNDKLNLLAEDTKETVSRKVLLDAIDRHWRWHLDEMVHLKSGITLRSFAQKNPLSEYESEGYELFQMMLFNIKQEATQKFLNI